VCNVDSPQYFFCFNNNNNRFLPSYSSIDKQTTAAYIKTTTRSHSYQYRGNRVVALLRTLARAACGTPSLLMRLLFCGYRLCSIIQTFRRPDLVFLLPTKSLVAVVLPTGRGLPIAAHHSFPAIMLNTHVCHRSTTSESVAARAVASNDAN
jgi:hypothetical protein